MWITVYFFALFLVLWTTWKVLRRFICQSSLDNIPGPPSKSHLKGVFPQLFSPNSWNFHRDIADNYGAVIKINALLGEKQLYVFDPKALNHILIKDQAYYDEAPTFINTNLLIFGPGVFSTLGEQHWRQRRVLAPVFSTSHLHEMMPMFYGVGHKLKASFASRVKSGVCEIDILSWMNRTALELIAQSGMGHSFDLLTDDGIPHPYTESAKQLGPTMFKLLLPRMYLLPIFRNFGPARFRRFIVDVLPWKSLHKLRDISDLFHKTSLEIYEARKAALEKGDKAVERQIGCGKDILSILMKANMSAKQEDALTKAEVLAQMSSLTFAAVDTTSIALTRFFHQLSIHPEVQCKLRTEIREARGRHGDLDYDQILDLPYLDAVWRETMRLYPPASFVIRHTQKDMVLPVSKPIHGLDGTALNEVVVPQGTNIICGLLALNCHPDVWGPDSYDWKPERWLEPLPDTVSRAKIPGVYSNLMTFLGGGRGCIGFKHAELEMKVVITLLVESFEFSLSEKEIFWQLSSIVSPIVLGEDGPQLPLLVKSVP